MWCHVVITLLPAQEAEGAVGNLDEEDPAAMVQVKVEDERRS